MMTEKHLARLGVLSLLVLGVLLVNTAGASVLINDGSFEAPAITAGWTTTVAAPTGWANTFGDGSVQLYYPVSGMDFYGQLDGNQAVLIGINDRITAVDSGIVMQEGVDVTLYFDAAWVGNDTFVDRFRVYHPGGFTPFNPLSKVGGMTTMSLTYTPTGVDDGQTFNPGFLPLSGSDTIILDNVRVVPEPATMAILGLGGIVTLIRRKR